MHPLFLRTGIPTVWLWTLEIVLLLVVGVLSAVFINGASDPDRQTRRIMYAWLICMSLSLFITESITH